MMPNTAQYASDSESLQADVMRFMAIIAFCLIAILALVRNVEPADVTEATAKPTVESTPITPDPEPRKTPAPMPVEVAVAEPVPETNPEPLPSFPESEPTSSEPEPVVAPKPVEAEPDDPAVPPLPQEAVEPDTTAPVDAGATEEGLILRFASDRDFLRLIARGDITVYAYQKSDVLSLDASYTFAESSAPGEVYELLTSSIPSLIVDALRRERNDIRGYRWGIALPRRISSQIEHQLESVKHGQLVIDRYGDVRHVAAS